MLLDRGKPDEERCQPAGNVTDRILEGKNDWIIVQLVAGRQQPRSRNPIQEQRAGKQQQPGAGIQQAHFVAVDVERQNQRRQTSASQPQGGNDNQIAGPVAAARQAGTVGCVQPVQFNVTFEQGQTQ